MSKSINTTGEFYFGVFEEKLTVVYTRAECYREGVEAHKEDGNTQQVLPIYRGPCLFAQ